MFLNQCLLVSDHLGISDDIGLVAKASKWKMPGLKTLGSRTEHMTQHDPRWPYGCLCRKPKPHEAYYAYSHTLLFFAWNFTALCHVHWNWTVRTRSICSSHFFRKELASKITQSLVCSLWMYNQHAVSSSMCFQHGPHLGQLLLQPRQANLCFARTWLPTITPSTSSDLGALGSSLSSLQLLLLALECCPAELPCSSLDTVTA